MVRKDEEEVDPPIQQGKDEDVRAGAESEPFIRRFRQIFNARNDFYSPESQENSRTPFDTVVEGTRESMKLHRHQSTALVDEIQRPE